MGGTPNCLVHAENAMRGEYSEVWKYVTKMKITKVKQVSFFLANGAEIGIRKGRYHKNKKMVHVK